jgi:hypothetical protein
MMSRAAVDWGHDAFRRVAASPGKEYRPGDEAQGHRSQRADQLSAGAFQFITAHLGEPRDHRRQNIRVGGGAAVGLDHWINSLKLPTVLCPTENFIDNNVLVV